MRWILDHRMLVQLRQICLSTWLKMGMQHKFLKLKVVLSSDQERSEQPRDLPEELAKNVMVLTCESSAEGGSCVVHVIGTSHVSKESCRQVKEVISYLKPEVVFLELCNEREFMLKDKEKLNLEVPTLKEMLHSMMKEHNPLGVVYSSYLVKTANHLGVVHGAEFQVAFDEAKKYGGNIVLGDRPVEITLRRTWEPMPLWQKNDVVEVIIYLRLKSTNYQVLSNSNGSLYS